VQELYGIRDTVIQDNGETETMEKSDQGQCYKRNLERADVREEMSGVTGMQQWNKETKPKGAIMTGKHGKC
jgi:hypothetical protein